MYFLSTTHLWVMAFLLYVWLLLCFFISGEKKAGLHCSVLFLISGLAVQLIKNLVNAPGPKLYFEAGTYLNFIDGVTLSDHAAFPSGHTATAFAIATVLVLVMKNRRLQLLILLAAALVGYSRIYLAQHFLLDVTAGALLGTVSGVLSFYLVQNKITIKRSFENTCQPPSGSLSASPGAMQTA
jgi:membrane-associated phospholipid phosphatase